MLPEVLAPYMQLKTEGITRIVLCLLVEEMLAAQLAAFRPKNLLPEPVESEEKLLVGRGDVVAVSDTTG